MKTDLCFQKWHDEFRKFSLEHVRKCKNWDFDGILLFEDENVWSKNLEGSFVSWGISIRNLTNFDPST